MFRVLSSDNSSSKASSIRDGGRGGSGSDGSRKGSGSGIEDRFGMISQKSDCHSFC